MDLNPSRLNAWQEAGEQTDVCPQEPRVTIPTPQGWLKGQ